MTSNLARMLAITGTAIAAISGSPQALADAQVQFELQNLSVGLRDLDPGDGISPWISYGSAELRFDGHVDDGAGGHVSQSYNAFGDWFEPMSDHRTIGTASILTSSSGATLGSNGSFSGLTLGAQGHAAPHGEFAGFAGLAFNIPGGEQFALSPHTALTFSTTLAGRASVTAGGSYEAAGGRVSFQAGVLDADRKVVWRESDEAFLSTGSGDGQPSGSFSRSFSTEILNPGNGLLSGYFLAQISIDGRSESFTAPVPEPSTYGLMLAGLGLLAFVRHRRSRRVA